MCTVSFIDCRHIKTIPWPLYPCHGISILWLVIRSMPDSNGLQCLLQCVDHFQLAGLEEVLQIAVVPQRLQALIMMVVVVVVI